MKTRTLALALALALFGLAGPSWAQYPQKRATLAHQWNLNGESADDDQVVTAATLADSTTFAIAAQPDSCRLIDATVVDADSSTTAGTLTTTGVDCLGYARVCTFDFAVVATRGSGVKTLPVTTGSGSSCILASVTSVITSALTGEGGAGDTLKVGYTSNSAVGWGLLGTLKAVGPNGEHGVDPSTSTAVALPITTSDSKSTTVAAVSNNGAFAGLQVGDLIQFDVGTVTYERRITALASTNSITVDQTVTIPSTGVAFSFKRFYYSTDPTDEMVIPVQGYKTAMISWAVDANVDTGGVQMILQGVRKGPLWPTGAWVTLCPVAGVDCSGITQSVASGSTAARSEAVDLTLLPFTHLKVGWKFGTGDDIDTAPESITYGVTLLGQ